MNRAAACLLMGVLAVTLAACPASAAVKILKNHGFDPDAPALTCKLGFHEFDEFAVKFVAGAQDYPYIVRKIYVLACGGGTVLWTVDMWHDNEDTNPAPDASLYVGTGYGV